MTTMRNNPSHYDEFSPSWYDRHWSSTKSKPCASHLWAARMVRGSVLDVGCRSGLRIYLLKDRGGIIDVDFSAFAVAQCRDKGHEAVKAPVESLPFPDAAFHTVVAKAGMRIHTDASGVSSAHLLLAMGTWHIVAPEYAFPTDHDSYYICRVIAEMPVGMAVRMFIIWYDNKGMRLHHNHMGTLRSGSQTTTCIFSAAPDSSHFAIALHLGDQPPQNVITLQSVTLQEISFDGDYRFRKPEARTAAQGQALAC